MIERMIDSIVSAFSPTAGLRRIAHRAALATYAAADKGRRNKDWKARAMQSADAAYIPDAETVNARCRQLQRDSWIMRAALRGAKRMIVGRGIVPVMMAKDESGKLLTDYNASCDKVWMKWACDREACDIEKRQTFAQKLRMCVAEKKVVGQHFIVWSYEPNEYNVGVRLQSFEPEQLDRTKQYHVGTDGITRQVRGGIEVDDNGAAVAYHFFRRPINDFMTQALKSVRIPRVQVFHWFEQERTLQAHGVPEAAPVAQMIRDHHRRDNAEIWTAIMESCAGAVITRLNSTPFGGTAGVVRPPGEEEEDDATGLKRFDFVPGMVFEAAPGEDVKFNNPTRASGNYEPYAKMSIRGVGAAMGQSYGQLARQSEGNYSSARQDMLTDYAEIEPEQDDLIDLIVQRVHQLVIAFAVVEGRVKTDPGGRVPMDPVMFGLDRDRYLEAEYLTPPKPWIDPKNEMDAIEKAIELRIGSRSEFIAQRGGRIDRVMRAINDDRKTAAAQGTTFAEDVETSKPTASVTPGLPAASPPTALPPPVDASGRPDAGVITDTTLNGAQIESAVNVLVQVRSGAMGPDGAAELLVAVGIPRDRALVMVTEAQKLPPLPLPVQ